MTRRILFRIVDQRFRKTSPPRALCPKHVSPEQAIVYEWRPLLRLVIRRQVDPLREPVSPDRFRIGRGQFHAALEPSDELTK